ncbi:MAG: glycoside hydrolase family 3 C-terminal domain-containing protein [Lachnoclostridium sp.]|nr:glycoside hydrolase family 3 C-terminal domain-containing protein [Lachnoclostridium sp.]
MKKYILSIALLCAALTPSAQALPYLDSSLSHEARVDDLMGRLTLDEKISLMMDQSPAIDRLGIPEYNWWNEALHGVGRAGLATVLPQSIGMAATFDEELVKEAFDMVSDEARAKYNDFRAQGDKKRYHGLTFWTPNVNIFRDPRWGRGQETYGEDPYLTQKMGVAVVEGLQGTDSNAIKTIAGAKHFAVHSGPEWNRHSFDARDIDPRDLRETYLPAFRSLVDAGVGQVMCAYNRFEGEPCCSSKKLLQHILRNEWGYDKIIVSDCWAIRDFVTENAHHTHPSNAHAGADAVISGTDLECGPIYKDLGKAVAQGLITEAQIDESLRKLLLARFALGEIFPDLTTPYDTIPLTVVDSEAHRALALEMARKSITLLKNNGVLPLKADNSRIMVMGPNAIDSVAMWGNYNGFPSHTVTLLEGVRDVIPGAMYARGCNHVDKSDLVSVFNLLQNGFAATYYNNTELEGSPVATDRYTSPLNMTTGGATVFAPGVNLEDFSGRFEGTFVPDADGIYVLAIAPGKYYPVVRFNGEVVTPRGSSGAAVNYEFTGVKGKPVDISFDWVHKKNIAELKVDIMKEVDPSIDLKDVDVVIFAGGISPKLEGEEMKVNYPGFRGGDRTSIELPEVQRTLMRSLKEQGKKVILVNFSGSAVALEPEDEICDAIIQAWYPGQAGGRAVADVLFGSYNPAGRLPVTFYRNDSQLPDFEDYNMPGHTYRYFTGSPLYPFGHGLSYTTFKYPSASLDRTAIKAGEGVKLTLDIANTGDRDGEEVAQVYIKKAEDTAGPVKTLKAYRRVPVKAGATEKVTFDLPADAFETFDGESGLMKTTPGHFTISYGGSSATTGTLNLIVE